MRAVAGSVHGPLLEALAVATEFKDGECVDAFRHGARLLEKLRASGKNNLVKF